MNANIEFNLDAFLRERDELKENLVLLEKENSRLVKIVDILQEQLFQAYCKIYKTPKNEMAKRKELFAIDTPFPLGDIYTGCFLSEKAFKVKLNKKSKKKGSV